MSIDVSQVDERVALAGIPLRNAVLTASGTFGYGTEFAPFLDLEKIGGFVAKSLTLEPRFGNPPPRIGETPAGMLNAISIENVGVRAFLDEKLPALPEGVVVIASAFGTAPEQYAELAAEVSVHPRISGIEINASCPHVKAGGIEFGQDPNLLGELVRTVRAATQGPLLVKLSPNVTRIADMAKVCEDEGADGISLINAVQAMEIDVETRRPVLSNVLGGLSGPAIRPIALRMVWQAASGGEDSRSAGRGDRERRRRRQIPALRSHRGAGRHGELPRARRCRRRRPRHRRIRGPARVRAGRGPDGRPLVSARRIDPPLRPVGDLALARLLAFAPASHNLRGLSRPFRATQRDRAFRVDRWHVRRGRRSFLGRSRIGISAAMDQSRRESGRFVRFFCF